MMDRYRVSSTEYKVNSIRRNEPFAINCVFLVEYVFCVLYRLASLDYEPVYLKLFCFHLPCQSEFSTIEGFTSQRQAFTLIGYVFASVAYRFATREEAFASWQIIYG